MKSILGRIKLNAKKSRSFSIQFLKNFYTQENNFEGYSSQSDDELNIMGSSPELENMINLNIHHEIKIDKLSFKNDLISEENLENIKKQSNRLKLQFNILKDIRTKTDIYHKYTLLKYEISNYFVYAFNDNKLYQKYPDMSSPWFSREELNMLRKKLLPEYDSKNDNIKLKSIDEMRDFLILSYFYYLIGDEVKNIDKIINNFINNFLIRIENKNERLKLEDIYIMMMVEKNLDSIILSNLVWNCIFKLFDKPITLDMANDMISKYVDYEKIYIFPFTNVIIWTQIKSDFNLNNYHIKRIVTNILTTIYNLDSKLERSQHYMIFKHLANRKFYVNEKLLISQIVLKIFIRYANENILTIQFFFKNFIIILKKELLIKEYIEEILTYFSQAEIASKNYDDPDNKLLFFNLLLFNKLISCIIKKPYYNDGIRNSLLKINKQFEDYFIEKNLSEHNSDIYLLIKVSKRVLDPYQENKFTLNIKDLSFKNEKLKNIISCVIVISDMITPKEMNCLHDIIYTKLSESKYRDKFYFNNFLFTYYLQREKFSKLIPNLLTDYSKYLKWLDPETINFYALREVVHLISIFFCSLNYEEKIFNDCADSEENPVLIPANLSLENLKSENLEELKSGNYRLTLSELYKINLNLFKILEKQCKHDMILLSIIISRNLLFLTNNKFTFQEYYNMFRPGFLSTFSGNYNNRKDISKHIRSMLKFLPLIIKSEANDKVTFLYLKYLTKFLLILIKKIDSTTEENNVKSFLHKFYEIYIFYKEEFDSFEKKFPRQFYVRLLLKKRFNMQRKKLNDGPVKVQNREYELPNIRETSISDNYFI